MEEQLSGACTIEIAAFDEFTRLLADPVDHGRVRSRDLRHRPDRAHAPAAQPADRLGRDSSPRTPPGPRAWDRSPACSSSGRLYQASLATLADASQTTVVLVARPDSAALTEAERTRRRTGGPRHPQPAPGGERRVRGVGRRPDRRRARSAWTRGVASMPAGLRGLSRERGAASPMGPDRRGARARPPQRPRGPAVRRAVRARPHVLQRLHADRAGRRACASRPRRHSDDGQGRRRQDDDRGGLAAELARRGFPVHLTTTDPAAHVAAAIGDAWPGLRVSRIDAAARDGRYADEVLASGGGPRRPRARPARGGPAVPVHRGDRGLPGVRAGGRRRRARVRRGRHGADRAHAAAAGCRAGVSPRGRRAHRAPCPTACGSCCRACAIRRSPASCWSHWPRRRPCTRRWRCRTISRRAGIAPFAWVVNQSFAAVDTDDAVLRARGSREHRYLKEVRQQFEGLIAVTPWVPIRPAGQPGLRAFVDASAAATPHARVPSS